MMADRMPNASYHYRAVVLSYTQSSTALYWKASEYVKENYFKSDNGVFVRGAGNDYFGCPRSTSRITEVNSDRYAWGGINMNTSDSETNCYSFGITNDGSHSGVMCLGLYKGSTKPFYGGRSYSGGKISPDTELYQRLSIMVDKVEICRKIVDSEIVYITGVSMLSTVDDKFCEGAGFIIARSVPISGDGYITEEEGGSSNGSVIFYSTNGSVIGCISGTNVTSTSATIISQSIPNSAMVGNDGICAVSCMCMADGNAAWLSHKNGIYKLYQGATPLNGMPGEKITIKGHEFVCLAYGPFYARMS